MTEDEKLKLKRTEQIYFTVEILLKEDVIDGNRYVLDPFILSELVDYYCQELHNIKGWYNVNDKANTSKIAGIMVNAILQYRPWVSNKGLTEPHGRYDGNELIAIYHGLMLCAIEGENESKNKEKVRMFMMSPNFESWLNLFKYILHNKVITTDLLILVFDTIGTFEILAIK